MTADETDWTVVKDQMQAAIAHLVLTASERARDALAIGGDAAGNANLALVAEAFADLAVGATKMSNAAWAAACIGVADREALNLATHTEYHELLRQRRPDEFPAEVGRLLREMSDKTDRPELAEYLDHLDEVLEARRDARG